MTDTDIAPSPFGTLLAEAAELQGDAVRLRRDLHVRPEIGLQLPHTQDRILAALHGLPLHVRMGEQVSSVVAVLKTASCNFFCVSVAIFRPASICAWPVRILPFASTS